MRGLGARHSEGAQPGSRVGVDGSEDAGRRRRVFQHRECAMQRAVAGANADPTRTGGRFEVEARLGACSCRALLPR